MDDRVYLKQCHQRPGWFRPEQLNRLTQYMGYNIDYLFSSYLAIDWYDKEDGSKVYIIAPGLKYHNTGVEYPKDPVGTCIFLTDKNKCILKDARPRECKLLLTDQFRYIREEIMIPGIQDLYREKRKEIALSWEDHQGVIKKLLGREPCGHDFNFKDIVERAW